MLLPLLFALLTPAHAEEGPVGGPRMAEASVAQAAEVFANVRANGEQALSIESLVQEFAEGTS